MDHAICPCCGKKTEHTDKQAEDDPNALVECEHCGCEFPIYYADFVEDEDP
jgi:hypothetical protein